MTSLASDVEGTKSANDDDFIICSFHDLKGAIVGGVYSSVWALCSTI